MKLSKILEIENLSSVTIEVINPNLATVKTFIKGKGRPYSKRYKSIDVDVEMEDTSIRTVEHLGIKRYRFLKTKNFYVNFYNY